MEQISKACLMICDVLIKDENAAAIIEKIDTAENDADLISGLKEAIEYMKRNEFRSIAEDVESKLQGFI